MSPGRLPGTNEFASSLSCKLPLPSEISVPARVRKLLALYPSITSAYWPFTSAAANVLCCCKSTVPSSTLLLALTRKKARDGLTIQNTSGIITEVPPEGIKVTCTRPFEPNNKVEDGTVDL